MESARAIQLVSEDHLGAIFFRRVEELGERPFIKLERNGRAEAISWRDFGTMVGDVMLALDRLGLARGSTVAIIGENSLTWLCADLATLAGGFPNVVIAPGLSDARIVQILNHAECHVAFVENVMGAARLLNLKSLLPALWQIITMANEKPQLPGTISIAGLVGYGKGAEGRRLQQLLQSVCGSDLATIMYTSGSTGEPKGVMRTHGNLLSNITSGQEIKVSAAEELFVIVLSLNHLFGRFGFLKSVVTGRTTVIIESAEGDISLDAIGRWSPTSMAVVPRVMAPIWNALLGSGNNRELWQELETLQEKKAAGTLGGAEGGRFEELKSQLRQNVKRALGGRMEYVTYGGAAMPPRIMRFFELSGVPLVGAYGSTECGGVTLCGIGDARPGSLGKPFPNVELRIAADGEILVRGPTVTPGYFKDPDATREAIDADGWFHSGDLGTLDAEGCLYVMGRKKDVFYCADGSNIFPGRIELMLENDPFVRQAILVGDHRHFIAALIVPDRNRIGAELSKDPLLLSGEEIRTALQCRIEHINCGLEEVEKIRKFSVMATDFPPEVRSLTSFKKIKVDRRAVEEHYRREIEEIYKIEPETSL
jgi:long-chain acyl-CoA synthetase